MLSYVCMFSVYLNNDISLRVLLMYVMSLPLGYYYRNDIAIVSMVIISS